MWYREAKKKDKPTEHTSVMVAFFLPKAAAKKLALDPKKLPDECEAELAEELHVTLAYLGKADALADKKEKIEDIIRKFAKKQEPVTGQISGYGRFTAAPDSHPFYASVDAPALPQFRQDLIEALERGGVEVVQNHGYTPHITLTYLSDENLDPHENVPNIDLDFGEITLAWRGKHTAFKLG